MTGLRDEFLSEEDLDLRNLTEAELNAFWNLWFRQAQATNDLDAALYSHGVFDVDPAPHPSSRLGGEGERSHAARGTDPSGSAL